MGYTSVHRKLEKPTKLETFSKNLSLGLNTIFIVFGFILLVYGVGGKTSTNRESFSSIIQNGETFKSTSNILIIMGLLAMLTGLYGLHGIKTYVKATIYTSLVIFLCFTDIALGIYSSSIESNAKASIERSLINSLQQIKPNTGNTTSSISKIRDSWDSLQSELRCCGVYGYSDWYLPIVHRSEESIKSVVENNATKSSANSSIILTTREISDNGDQYGNGVDFIRIPHSCFRNGDDLEAADFNSPEFIHENVYNDGCLEKTVADLDIDRVQRVGVLMASFKLLAVICAMILACHLNTDKSVNYV